MAGRPSILLAGRLLWLQKTPLLDRLESSSVVCFVGDILISNRMQDRLEMRRWEVGSWRLDGRNVAADSLGVAKMDSVIFGRLEKFISLILEELRQFLIVSSCRLEFGSSIAKSVLLFPLGNAKCL
jgi:hypothetical protein